MADQGLAPLPGNAVLELCAGPGDPGFAAAEIVGERGRLLSTEERGHIQPPEPGAPGVFSMASEERTRALLEDAGLTTVRIEEVAVQWVFPHLDE